MVKLIVSAQVVRIVGGAVVLVGGVHDRRCTNCGRCYRFVRKIIEEAHVKNCGRCCGSCGRCAPQLELWDCVHDYGRRARKYLWEV